MLTVRPSKTCGYIAYPVDYTEHQGSDPGASLCKGDEVEGYILTVRVKPYWVGKDFLTRCTVPVFCSKEDPVEFEIEMEKAIIRAGKEIDPKELEYGGIEQQLKVTPEIPKNCLVVKTIKQFN